MAAREKRGDKPESDEEGDEGDASPREEEGDCDDGRKAYAKARGKKRLREEEEVDEIESDNGVDVKPRVGEEWICAGCTYHVRFHSRFSSPFGLAGFLSLSLPPLPTDCRTALSTRPVCSATKNRRTLSSGSMSSPFSASGRGLRRRSMVA